MLGSVEWLALVQRFSCFSVACVRNGNFCCVDFVQKERYKSIYCLLCNIKTLTLLDRDLC